MFFAYHQIGRPHLVRVSRVEGAIVPSGSSQVWVCNTSLNNDDAPWYYATVIF